jgi:hypothetical protein
MNLIPITSPNFDYVTLNSQIATYHLLQFPPHVRILHCKNRLYTSAKIMDYTCFFLSTHEVKFLYIIFHLYKCFKV